MLRSVDGDPLQITTPNEDAGTHVVDSPGIRQAVVGRATPRAITRENMAQCLCQELVRLVQKRMQEYEDVTRGLPQQVVTDSFQPTFHLEMKVGACRYICKR